MKSPLPTAVLVLAAMVGGSIMAYGVQGGAADVGEAIPDSHSGQEGTELCPPLDPAAGSTKLVSNVSELHGAVNNASTGDTILVADGTYDLDGLYLRMDTPNVTLRSASGERDAVILDGNYITTEILQVVASNVTIADLTLREAYYHPIHVMSTAAGDTENTLIYNVHIIDPGEQAIKINPASDGRFPDDGIIACSRIELTDAGRPHIRNNCYTGGIDAHQAQGWVIRDNLIEGFWCPAGLSEHGIHFWRGSRDTVVERNRLNNNARGIGFGLEASGSGRTYADNPCPGAGGGYVDHYGGIIRNNFVFANRDLLFGSEYGFDCGICLWQACGAQVFHNSVVSAKAPFSSIEWRFDNTDVAIKNNLVSHNLRDRGGVAVLDRNLENVSISYFVDGLSGDLHLNSTATIAIDQAVNLAEVIDDIDGDGRPIGPAADIGADEYGMPAAAPVIDLRVLTATTNSGILTASLGWTAPKGAVTIALRYSPQPITGATWAGAALLTDNLPGDADAFMAAVPYKGEVVYFALKSRNAAGAWSELSNNAFWPSNNIFLPMAVH